MDRDTYWNDAHTSNASRMVREGGGDGKSKREGGGGRGRDEGEEAREG